MLDRALIVLVACLRLARGRKRRPTAAIIDSQSVRTEPQRGPCGYDAGKKIKGRRGFQLEPRRWKAEQVFGNLQRHRRLRVDDEMSCEARVAWPCLSRRS